LAVLCTQQTLLGDRAIFFLQSDPEAERSVINDGQAPGCESELNALGNVNFDLGRFGIEFVASPRQADGVVISDTTTRAMAHVPWKRPTKPSRD
jgi:hypothetical protein